MESNSTRFEDKFNFFPIVITLAASFVYFQTFFYKLIFLDDYYIVNGQETGNTFFTSAAEAFRNNYLGNHYYRPLTVISFIINAVISGSTPWIYHVTNVLIHIAVSILIYFFLTRQNYSKSVSFISAILFSVSTLHVNAVGWIAGRADLLAGLFTVTSLYLLSAKNQNWFNYILIFVAISFAVLSKEVALVVPFLLIYYIIAFPNKNNPAKFNYAIIIMAALVVLSYILIRTTLLSGTHIDKFSIFSPIENLPAIPETLFKFFIPFGIRALPDYNLTLMAIGTILLAVLVILPFAQKSIQRNNYYFGLVWFVLLMLPGMFFRTMITNGFFYWDCRSYTASIGLVIVLAEIIHLPSLKLSAAKFLSIVFLYLFVIGTSSYFHVRLYQSALTFWNSVAQDYPNRYLPHVQLFSYYSSIGNSAKCEAEIKQAVSLDPANIVNRTTLINFYLKEAKYNDALDQVQEGMKYSSDQNDFSLVSPLVRSCAKLGKIYPLINLIKGNSNDLTRLKKLKEICVSEAQNFYNHNDLNAYTLVMESIKYIDFTFDLSSSNKTR